MRTVLITFAGLLFTVTSFAQEGSPETNFWSDPLANPAFPFYVVVAFVFLTAFMVILVALYMLQVLNVFIRKAAEERAEKLGIPIETKPSWWTNFWYQINAFKPAEKETDILLDHNYDGIKELDNHLPPWWKWLLYGTIVWAAVYMVVYHIANSLPLQEAEYQAEVALADEQKAKFIASNPPVAIDESALVYAKDDEIIQKGRKVYVTNCASCHMPEGQGSIGPNLTDEYWLHGGSVKEIYTVIKNGVVEKGMIPWGPVLSPEQMRDVTFYIMSIQGTTPANPKPPQGVLYKVEENVKPDSVKSSI